MNGFMIVGLGRFGQCMLTSLVERRLHVLVIDSDEQKIQHARDVATRAVKADALEFALFQEIISDDIRCAIVDLGDEMERSILVTNYLHKLNVPSIIVEAVNPAHAEILQVVGATRIVFPEQEAAERLAGLLAGEGAINYFPVGERFSLVELPVPAKWVGETLMDLSLRKKKRINVVAVRKQVAEPQNHAWSLIEPEHVFAADEIVLLAGSRGDLEHLS
jgi:trk system potassium uptake protein TrkA